ncbi:cytochrome C oxidase subunit IV family protein [Neptunomonas antarctica]|uniref:Cytochrome C oxidase subunit IV n=1 Tax=Neptunomonas antarctica TaxID=619304 RepID=A0A1N7P8N1_9GAMM|nr:cytochrome C oxidase subunit IV family protein [Neptunomonas antarctica]SIT06933.1 Cytochrome C oxidase subunit IV [Neptunomonas antarctica]
MKHPFTIWLVLIILTLTMFMLGEVQPSPEIIMLVLAISAVKGLLIVLGFMELAGVKHLVQRALLLYSPIVVLLIALLLL